MLAKFLNLDLLSNPFNWVTLTLMVVIGGLGLALIHRSSGAAANGD